MQLVVESHQKVEFGDFQTPYELALEASNLLKKIGIRPRSIVEPTCGIGNFLFASSKVFPEVETCIGVEVNPKYISIARQEAKSKNLSNFLTIRKDNFFDIDWNSLVDELPEPILFIGNPPWVTNATLGTIKSKNLPSKSNFQKHNGFDAITGKSNFDISEWMLMKIIETLKERSATMAMLCKTTVARKLLAYTAKNNIPLKQSRMYSIDASLHFNASVDSCFFVYQTEGSTHNYDCKLYNSLRDKNPSRIISYRNGHLIADIQKYARWQHLENKISPYLWRSGIKHDCSKVMELEKEGDLFINSLKEKISLEETYLYPMLKSSDLANNRIYKNNRWMLIPQRFVGQDTLIIKRRAPLTWKYLIHHKSLLDARKSTIYKKQPPFSIFGVGPYSFAPWKIAISGLYKKINFIAIGSRGNKPTILDDTCYSLPCGTEKEAKFLLSLITSPIATEFYESLIFFDSKRPVNKEILQQLNIFALAKEMRVFEKLSKFSRENNFEESSDINAKQLVFSYD